MIDLPLKTELLINGADIAGQSYLNVTDPGAFANVVGTVAQASVTQMDEAVVAAHRAFPKWRDTAFGERAALMQQVAQIIAAEKDTLKHILMHEQGMLSFFIQRELTGCPHVVAGLIELAEDFLKPDIYEDETSKAVVHKKPLGVVVGIVPWNAPIFLTMAKLAPALLAGNTIVIKPSPGAPLGVSYLLRKIADVLPAGVVNVIHGDAEVAAGLTAHPLVRKISFTGGGETASHIMRSAAATIKGVHFELGGNDPALVLDDADPVKVAKELLNSAFGRSGQLCFAAKRIYVADAIYDRFVSTLCSATDEYKIGHPTHSEATFGPVHNKAQYDHVERLIQQAREKGAEVHELGQLLEPEKQDKGYYRKPVIVAEADHSMDVVVLEQFGPVLPVIRIRDDEEAITLANSTEFGLSASVWSADQERAIAVAERLECGRAYVNAHREVGVGLSTMPFGGVKQSGLGWEQGTYGLAEYIEYHSVNYAKFPVS